MAQDKKNTAVYVAYEEQEPYDTALPERNLLRAILLNAMADINKAGEVGRKAEEYFLNADEEYLFSFRSICNHLNIDPKTILIVTGLKAPSDRREGLRALKSPKHPTKEV